jgi:hypothetical protein
MKLKKKINEKKRKKRPRQVELTFHTYDLGHDIEITISKNYKASFLTNSMLNGEIEKKKQIKKGIKEEKSN